MSSMLVLKDIEKYDMCLENYKNTLCFLLKEIYWNKTSRHRNVYIMIFNKLTGGNYDFKDF